MKIEKDYEDLLKLFNRHKVEYCLVGAYALAFHARPRYTKDMDILIRPGEANGIRIVAALKEFGFDGLGLQPSDFARDDCIIQLGYEPVRIDLITSIAGVGFDEVWNGKVAGEYGNQDTYFIGKNELIKNKKAANRHQDQADLELLLPASDD